MTPKFDLKSVVLDLNQVADKTLLDKALLGKARSDRARVEELARIDARMMTLTRDMNYEAEAVSRYAKAHPRSAELIKYSNSRGMSRAAMNRIWGARLVNAVLSTENKP